MALLHSDPSHQVDEHATASSRADIAAGAGDSRLGTEGGLVRHNHRMPETSSANVGFGADDAPA